MNLQQYNQIRILNSGYSHLDNDVLAPFALEEILCNQVGNNRIPIVHLWQHTNALVLGLRDYRLPLAKGVISNLRSQGVSVAVRHSGGAAVPLDAGVLNLSFILPLEKGKINYKNDFEFLAQFIIRSIFSNLNIVQIGEVEGSYCPGDYDLSISGKKFCGIAQRRQTNASIIHAFIIVEGKGQDRSGIVLNFYRQAAAENSDLDFPKVKIDTMQSIAESLRTQTLKLNDVESRIMDYLQQHASLDVIHSNDICKREEIETKIRLLRNRYEPLNS